MCVDVVAGRRGERAAVAQDASTQNAPELLADQAVDGEVGGGVESEQCVGDAVGCQHCTRVKTHRRRRRRLRIAVSLQPTRRKHTLMYHYSLRCIEASTFKAIAKICGPRVQDRGH